MGPRSERAELERRFALEVLTAEGGIPNARILRQRVVYRALIEYGQVACMPGAGVRLCTLPAAVLRLSRELELTAVGNAPLLVAQNREGVAFTADAAAWQLTRKARGLLALLRRIKRAREGLAWSLLDSWRDRAGTDAAP